MEWQIVRCATIFTYNLHELYTHAQDGVDFSLGKMKSFCTVIWHGDLGTTYGKKYGKMQVKIYFNKSQHGIGFSPSSRDFHGFPWVRLVPNES